MSEPKWTPGPWSLNGQHAPWVCTVGGNVDDPAVFGRPAKPGEAYQFGDKLADAHLIAAAPKLYAALQRLTDQVKSEFMLDGEWTGDSLFVKHIAVIHAEDALAEARGEQS